MSKILFSLLVHEEPIIILEQIINIKRFNPNSIIVLHFNKKFSNKDQKLVLSDLLKIVDSMDGVYMNPHAVEVGWENIIQGHMSNIKFAHQFDYDYFYFLSSNELFLRSGAEELISQYDYGCQKITFDKWHYYDRMKKDEGMKNILSKLGTDQYYYSQIEGTFYRKEMIEEMSDFIKQCFDYKKQKFKYPREEVYFPTIANQLYKDKKRFDGCLCRIRWEGKILFTSISAAKKVYSGKIENKFSVKRVDRYVNNYLRCYIRHYLLKCEDEIKKYYPYQYKVQPLIWIYFKNFGLLIHYFFRNLAAKTYRFVFRKK